MWKTLCFGEVFGSKCGGDVLVFGACPAISQAPVSIATLYKWVAQPL